MAPHEPRAERDLLCGGCLRVQGVLQRAFLELHADAPTQHRKANVLPSASPPRACNLLSLLFSPRALFSPLRGSTTTVFLPKNGNSAVVVDSNRGSTGPCSYVIGTWSIENFVFEQ